MARNATKRLSIKAACRLWCELSLQKQSMMEDPRTSTPHYVSTLAYLFTIVEASVNKHFPKLPQPLCEFHEVCWCVQCLTEYKTSGFTKFRNACEHLDVQCSDAHLSTHYINQLQLILKYADHLEASAEEEIIRQLDSMEMETADPST